MAEICSKCSRLFDIDLVEEALELDYGHSINFICERCPNRGLYKDEKGIIYIAVLNDTNNEIELVESKIEDLQK